MKKNIVIILLLCIIPLVLYANVDETVDNIRITIEDYSGTVTIYRKSIGSRFVSMFDSKTFTKTPAYYVLYEEAVLPVNTAGGFRIQSSYQNNIATFTATLKGKLEVTATYELFSANDKQIVDSVKVTSSIKNISNGSREVALKAFFDTWLGENTPAHFSTVLRDTINSEATFTNIINDKWIQSASDTDIIRFVVPEDEVEEIDNIVVANKNLLSQLNWYYNIQRGREFHSLNSYNNSALAITWDTTILHEEDAKYVSFYMLTGGATLLVPSGWPRESTTAQEEVAVQTQQEEAPIEEIPAEENAFSNLSPEDLQKILALIETINSLKENNSYLNEQEILSLNAEVDAILENAGR